MTHRHAASMPIVFALACAPLASTAALPAQETFLDPHSFSRPGDVVVRHLELDLTVDFENRRLSGHADLTIERVNPGAEELILDTRDLDVGAVKLDGTEPVEFRLSDALPLLGRSLTIPIGAETKTVRVEYRTSPEAAALQWLEPSQTAGGQQPFLFSQSQAILARTWVPCQDTPGVRMTYSATVRVPPHLLAVMSAKNPTAKRADGVYRFAMDEPIPSYLLAIGVGDLEFRSLGKRSGVYAEPSMVESAAWELADTEKMIVAAEKLYGPYRWGRYDLLVLPPSFPFGGMENPRLTFATPTILAGDRSLVALVAHELAHSWSGNLVTNATWNDFWLNEGFTSYFENRIMQAVYGRDYADMQLQLSVAALREAIAATKPAEMRQTWLYADLTGKDPDDLVGPIAYDKGALLLHTLEHAVGREAWDAFLRRYFEHFAFQSMTTAKFLEYLEENLLADHPEAAKKVDVRAWVYGPGLPPSALEVKSEALAKVDRQVERFAAGTPAAELATEGWSTHEWLRFLDRLPADLPKARFVDLDAAFGFTRSGNSEILASWFVRAIRADYEPAYPAIEKFLVRVGRRKFLSPIYRELAKTPAGLERAKAIYAKARPGYHAVSRGTIDQMLDWEDRPAG
jgi:leukotriene A-4 hydrolase/aminopeptidase